MNVVKDRISRVFKKAVKDLYSVDLNEIKLENPPKKELGDFCFAPFILSKHLGKSPIIISNELKKVLENDPNFLEISIVGPYLNFRLSYEFYTEIFLNEEIKVPNVGNGKTVVVDYIGANVGKPLHIGHMCTPSQGQVTCNLFRALGYNVIGDSHIGDWGIIFGKLILAYKMWGSEDEFEKDPINHLFELYVKMTSEAEKDSNLEEKVRQEFKRLSEGDPESVKLWQKFTTHSILEMQSELDRLNVKPDFNIGESFYEGIGLPKTGNYPDLKYKMSDIVKELIEKKIAIKNEDGSVGVVFPESTKIPSCVLVKRDGTHGYLASDLATIKYRVENWNPEKIIYHVDVRQELHFKQVFEIAESASWISKDKLFFAGNGFISLKTGAISTRKGNIIRLSDLLDEAINRARKILLDKNPSITEERLKEISEIIGIGAIKYGYLSKSRMTDMVFDWDEFMTFEGNSFPYVAYSYVRALSILKKSGISKDDIKRSKTKEIFSSPYQVSLCKDILALGEVLVLASESVLYHNLVLYAYNLAKDFSNFYSNVSILGEEDFGKKVLNLKLVLSYVDVQKLIFDILAIKLPKEM